MKSSLHSERRKIVEHRKETLLKAGWNGWCRRHSSVLGRALRSRQKHSCSAIALPRTSAELLEWAMLSSPPVVWSHQHQCEPQRLFLVRSVGEH